jgi:hypothetical protein
MGVRYVLGREGRQFHAFDDFLQATADRLDKGCHHKASPIPDTARGLMPDPVARLIYHPRRERRAFGSVTVYFDSTVGNQDPHVWNDTFLHPYCHITQFHAGAADINLWVSGDRFPDFSQLYCEAGSACAPRGRRSRAEPGRGRESGQSSVRCSLCWASAT